MAKRAGVSLARKLVELQKIVQCREGKRNGVGIRGVKAIKKISNIKY